MLRPRVDKKEPPRLGSTICYGQTWARKSHQDSAVRFVTAKSWPERATKTRQYDLLRPRCWPERATKTRQYDLLRPNVGLKEPPRLGSTICYGQTWARKSHQDSAVRFVIEPSRLGSAICYGQELARKSHQDSAVRFVPAKSCPERATKTRQYDLISAKSWPERATKTRQYDLLRPNVGQKEPPRLGSTICYGQELARKSHQDSAVRFVTAKGLVLRHSRSQLKKEPPRLGRTICSAKSCPERLQQAVASGHATRVDMPHADLLWPRFGQSKNHQDSAVRLVTAKRGPERASCDSAVRFVMANSWQ